MNKISNLQLFSILLLPGAWSILCIPALYGGGQLLGAAAGCGIQLLLCVPVFALARHGRETDFLRQKWLCCLYALFFILWGARSLTLMHTAVPRQLLTSPGHVTAAVLLLLTCLYTSTAGLKATARCAVLMLGVLGVTLVLLVVGAWRRVEPSALSAQGGFSQGMLTYLALGGELPAAWVLLQHAGTGGCRAVGTYLLAKLGLCLLVLFLCITAGGRLTSEAAYPLFTLTVLSQPFAGQRADAVYLLAFVMLCVMQMTLLTGVTAHLLEWTGIRHTAPLSLLLMLLLAWLLPEQGVASLTAALIPILAGGVPLVILMMQGLKRSVRA